MTVIAPQVVFYLKSLVDILPNAPGVYQYFDESGVVIYVGKAKDLKKRVSSYFNKEQDYTKTVILVSKIRDIKTIIVESEEDALLLENNLIKKYQPRYNIRLKDDKSYPWLVLKNEPFPRLMSTRKFVKDGSFYFGPYTSTFIMGTILSVIKQLYSLRTCNLNLNEYNINNNKFKVCLEYHIGNCKAPCVSKISDTEYSTFIYQIKDILNGNVSKIIQALKNQMKNYSDNYKYEEAFALKEKILILENFQSKSTIVNPSIHNVDVFSIVDSKTSAFVNFLKIINGSIIQTHTVELKKKLDESLQELLEFAITDIRAKFDSLSPEIIVPFPLDYKIKNVKYTIPSIGDKMKLLELSTRNASHYMYEIVKQEEDLNKDENTERILNEMIRDLQLQEKPIHIECFDNSNIQGTSPVASCVVFKYAKPSTKDYRHFNIKTVNGPNDFASMEEIVYRRYKRILDEGTSFPQLVVVDGGKGQLSSAMKSIEKLGLVGRFAVIGIAKRLEEIYFPGDSQPVYIDMNSETLKVIKQIRDEAHRFGITFHRKKRSKKMLVSELSSLKGIGSKTVQTLLGHFKSFDRLKKAQLIDIQDVVGRSKAELLISYFNKETNRS